MADRITREQRSRIMTLIRKFGNKSTEMRMIPAVPRTWRERMATPCPLARKAGLHFSAGTRRRFYRRVLLASLPALQLDADQQRRLLAAQVRNK